MIRPLGKWIVVELEPARPLGGGGLIVTLSEERIRTAKVIRVPVDCTELAVGDRVCFFRENMLHKFGKQLRRTLEAITDDEDIAMLKLNDVLCVLHDGVDVVG